jgi:catechol 2,3-dioxygenase-like lactoylglutathione lyase family enzyme
MSNQVIKGCGHHHIALYASDFDKSIKFYTEALGFKQLCIWDFKGERAAMLDVGDGSILEMFESKHLLEHPEKKKKGLYWHLSYTADDVDAAFKAAVAGGATPTQEPMDVEIPSSPCHLFLRNAFVIGPDGEVIEFLKVIK